jgi:hypothetical protein
MKRKYKCYGKSELRPLTIVVKAKEPAAENRDCRSPDQGTDLVNIEQEYLNPPTNIGLVRKPHPPLILGFLFVSVALF